MTRRYLCIHGHFYQPPRENPWLEDVEQQDSAQPFHDWNERITTECYRTNAAARILDRQGRIAAIVSNYERMSFNFGPSLLSWMEQHRPQTYRAILEADQRSRAHFSGHGAAMAQCYNHLIMPLANRRDKQTQVIWGLRDFAHRFGRQPEGMWLPETAVDLESLEIMAAEGIRFTVLAPHQAKNVRELGKKEWQNVEGGHVDISTPYWCRLPSGKKIAIFFYHGPASQEVAFARLLDNGERFAHRLLDIFSDRETAQLAHIATDGETYGHHHRHGEMGLAYALHTIEENELANLTIYGEYLKKHPPRHEVEILQNSSWSCAHGVERWRADCGCRIGGHDWHQKWRAPLREALDWLRDRLAPLYEKEMSRWVDAPWKARDEFIEVVLNRDHDHVERFLRRQTGRNLAAEEKINLLRLFEMQRHAMLMYTSCGWFFDDISGIETVQVLAYAGRAIQLARKACGAELEDEFLRRLSRAPSNVAQSGDGARIYREHIAATRLDLIRVAAHHAISSEFEGNGKPHRVYSYRARNLVYHDYQAGRVRLAIGRTHVQSDITWNAGEFSFAVLYFGGHHLNAGVREFQDKATFEVMHREIEKAFQHGDLGEVIRLMDRHFEHHNYSLWHLFKDEQRKILNQIMQRPIAQTEASFQQIYENQFALLQFLKEANVPAPGPLIAPVEIIMNARLRRLLETEKIDTEKLGTLAEEVGKIGIRLDEETLGLLAGRQIDRQLVKLARSPGNLALMMTISETLEILQRLPLKPDFWDAQNTYYEIRREHCPAARLAHSKGDRGAGEWLDQFRKLGDYLRIGNL